MRPYKEIPEKRSQNAGATPLSIHRFLIEDIYIVATATQSVREGTALVFLNSTSTVSSDIVITVMRIPAVSFVWIGAAVMIAGGIPFMFVRPHRSRVDVWWPV
jgi:cytochrome c biogenesis factor